MLILLLVFGTVVAALVPLAMAILSIIVAIGLTALVGQVTDLSIFVVNMISGMGLALAGGACTRSREARRDRGVGRDGEPRGPDQRRGVRSRDGGDADRPALD